MGKSGESTGTQKDQEPPKDGLGNAFQRTGDAPSGIRARDASGKFLPDIKETTQYNEAWVGGKSPKDMAASAAAAKQTGSPVTAATPSASQPKVGAITGRTNWWNVHERSPSGLVLGRAWKARQFIFALVPPLCAFILFENVDRWQKRNDAKKNANAGADLKVAPGAGGDISAMRSFGSFVQDAVGAAVLGKAMSAENRRFLESFRTKFGLEQARQEVSEVAKEKRVVDALASTPAQVETKTVVITPITPIIPVSDNTDGAGNWIWSWWTGPTKQPDANVDVTEDENSESSDNSKSPMQLRRKEKAAKKALGLKRNPDVCKVERILHRRIVDKVEVALVSEEEDRLDRRAAAREAREQRRIEKAGRDIDEVERTLKTK